MTELIANLQIQTFNALVAAPETISRLEVAISEADEIFQEEIAPLICIAPVLLAEGVILAVKWFIKASYWTFIAGQEIRDWYGKEWVGQFALAPTIEEPTPGSLFILPCLSEPDRSIVIAVPQAKATHQEYAKAELVGALDAPGATGKRTSRAKTKVSMSKAAAKPKPTRDRAEAK
jgi:hypothetical protein